MVRYTTYCCLFTCGPRPSPQCRVWPFAIKRMETVAERLNRGDNARVLYPHVVCTHGWAGWTVHNLRLNLHGHSCLHTQNTQPTIKWNQALRITLNIHPTSQMKHQLDATLCMFYFCRVTLHVSGASAHHQDDERLRPKHVEWPCRNKTCTVLHQVGVSFDL